MWGWAKVAGKMAELLMKSANHQRGHSVRIRAAPLLIGTRPCGYRKNHLNHARDSWIAARQAFENQVVQLRKPVCAGTATAAVIAIFVNRGWATAGYESRLKTSSGGQRIWPDFVAIRWRFSSTPATAVERPAPLATDTRIGACSDPVHAHRTPLLQGHSQRVPERIPSSASRVQK